MRDIENDIERTNDRRVVNKENIIKRDKKRNRRVWYPSCNVCIVVGAFFLAGVLEARAGVYNDFKKDNAGVYLTVGKVGSLARSLDGMNWIVLDSGVTRNLNKIAYSANGWVAVGDAGLILFSEDALNWTQILTGKQNGFVSVIWTGQFFVVYDNNGLALTSTNGVHWSPRDLTDPILINVVPRDDLVTVLDSSAHVVTIPDGSIWAENQGGIFFDGSNLVVKHDPYLLIKSTEKIHYQDWISKLNLLEGQNQYQDDPDRDGVVNLIEYSLNMNPVSDEKRSNLLGVKTRNQGIEVHFTRPQLERGDIKYIIEKSNNLLSDGWIKVAQRLPFDVWESEEVLSEYLNEDGGIKVSMSYDLGDYKPVFFRLRIDLIKP